VKRLSPEFLAGLPKHVSRPPPRRPGGLQIVHLGIGAFARAHLAVYTQDANVLDGNALAPWQIMGVSLQRPDMRDALRPQEGLYSVTTRAPEGTQYRIIDVVRDILVAPENPGAVIAMMADPATHIVSLTVTEKGYCHDPAAGRLRLDHPDIMHDLREPERPRTSIGFLVAGLQARRAQGLKPFTILCCDNLPANGSMLRRIVLDFAALKDDALAAWIAAEGAFPSTMVDRIVPATTTADIAETKAALGVSDAAPVMAEPFSQWVIEDWFVGNRPHWEQVGAQIVEDVAPFEFMKLRLLNGAHSTLAYLGYLAGHETVAAASGDTILAGMLERLWAEIIPTVPVPHGVDLAAYVAALLLRFQNPAIRHRTWQIAMDGSQKLPQRLLATIQDRISAGQPFNTLSLGVAGWMRYVMGFDRHGERIDVRDPLAADFAAIMDQASTKTGNAYDAAFIVDRLLAITSIFGEKLPCNAELRRMLARQLDSLLRHGVHDTVRNSSH
jgi:fructuronate reductase